MANHPSHSSRGRKAQANAETSAEQDMLFSILGSEQSAYPWQPDAADAYRDSLDSAGQALEFSESEVSAGWQAVSSQLDNLWGAKPSLQDMLFQKFANRLSPSLIEHISSQAQHVLANGRPMVDQLIACVRDVVAAWDEADLQVMARPLASAMRGAKGDFLNATIQSVRNADWETLDSMEQARISLAAARFALDYLQENQ
jgi:cell division septum initiation protein DivIVA